MFHAYVKNLLSMIINGDVCALNTLFPLGGSRWDTQTSYGNDGEGWRTSFGLRFANSAERQTPNLLLRRGSCPAPRPCGSILLRPNARFVASFVNGMPNPS